MLEESTRLCRLFLYKQNGSSKECARIVEQKEEEEVIDWPNDFPVVAASQIPVVIQASI